MRVLQSLSMLHPLIWTKWRETMKKYHVAVVGATGAVGNEMIKTLEQRNFPVEKLRLLASERSLGIELNFRGLNYAPCSCFCSFVRGIKNAKMVLITEMIVRVPNTIWKFPVRSSIFPPTAGPTTAPT